MLYGKSDDRKILRKEYFINRLCKASGVRKKEVRKVVDALTEVIYGVMADCMRIKICKGIILGGVKKEDSRRNMYNAFTGEYTKTKTFIRPTCEFNKSVKMDVADIYFKKHPDEKKE